MSRKTDNRDVHDRLCAALGLLQAYVLAHHSTLDRKQMFGHMEMGILAIEEAARLVEGTIGEVDVCDRGLAK